MLLDKKIFSILGCFFILTGCSYNNRFLNIENRLSKLESKYITLEISLFEINKGMVNNISQVNRELSQLHQETEAELNKQTTVLNQVRTKTDQFDVQSSKGGITFVPTAQDRDITLTHQDFWRSSDGRNVSGTGNPVYSFEVTTDSEIEITLVSQKTDTYLYLTNQYKTVIAKDDDGIDSKGSKITYQLEQGQYTIICATYSHGQSDIFELNLTGRVKNLRKIS